MTLSDALTRYTLQRQRRVTRPFLRFSLRNAANENQHGPLCNCPTCEHGGLAHCAECDVWLEPHEGCPHIPAPKGAA
tara:strand:- start:105 stop:335 length:231 start_codon:yes stop_codon:yes gene_type:complete